MDFRTFNSSQISKTSFVSAIAKILHDKKKVEHLQRVVDFLLEDGLTFTVGMDVSRDVVREYFKRLRTLCHRDCAIKAMVIEGFGVISREPVNQSDSPQSRSGTSRTRKNLKRSLSDSSKPPSKRRRLASNNEDSSAIAGSQGQKRPRCQAAETSSRKKRRRSLPREVRTRRLTEFGFNPSVILGDMQVNKMKIEHSPEKAKNVAKGLNQGIIAIWKQVAVMEEKESAMLTLRAVVTSLNMGAYSKDVVECNDYQQFNSSKVKESTNYHAVKILPDFWVEVANFFSNTKNALYWRLYHNFMMVGHVIFPSDVLSRVRIRDYLSSLIFLFDFGKSITVEFEDDTDWENHMAIDEWAQKLEKCDVEYLWMTGVDVILAACVKEFDLADEKAVVSTLWAKGLLSPFVQPTQKTKWHAEEIEVHLGLVSALYHWIGVFAAKAKTKKKKTEIDIENTTNGNVVRDWGILCEPMRFLAMSVLRRDSTEMKLCIQNLKTESKNMKWSCYETTCPRIDNMIESIIGVPDNAPNDMRHASKLIQTLMGILLGLGLRVWQRNHGAPDVSLSQDSAVEDMHLDDWIEQLNIPSDLRVIKNDECPYRAVIVAQAETDQVGQDFFTERDLEIRVLVDSKPLTNPREAVFDIGSNKLTMIYESCSNVFSQFRQLVHIAENENLTLSILCEDFTRPCLWGFNYGDLDVRNTLQKIWGLDPEVWRPSRFHRFSAMPLFGTPVENSFLGGRESVLLFDSWCKSGLPYFMFMFVIRLYLCFGFHKTVVDVLEWFQLFYSVLKRNLLVCMQIRHQTSHR